MAPLIPPEALLLDFGGVVFESRKRASGIAEFAREAHELLVKAGCSSLDESMLLEDIESGLTAWRAWKTSKSRAFAPRDVSHEEFWRDFVAADWPQPARDAAVAAASYLCLRLGHLEAERSLRPGAHDLLSFAAERGVGLAIVSNSLSGQVHRDIVQWLGLDGLFGAQIYSDECLVRKPNPEMIRLAAKALDVAVERCWYVGDTFDRDVLCGRRAGVGCTVLMVDDETYQIPYRVRAAPDLIVQDRKSVV